MNINLHSLRSNPAEHARIEGEGDGSLEYWKNAHKDYFPRELIPTGRHFIETMPVVFEQFRVVWPKAQSNINDRV